MGWSTVHSSRTVSVIPRQVAVRDNGAREIADSLARADIELERGGHEGADELAGGGLDVVEALLEAAQVVSRIQVRRELEEALALVVAEIRSRVRRPERAVGTAEGCEGRGPC